MIEPIDRNQPAYFYMMQYENLACPARFERATYALEVFVAAQKSMYFNGLSQKISTVQQTEQQFCRVNRHF